MGAVALAARIDDLGGDRLRTGGGQLRPVAPTAGVGYPCLIAAGRRGGLPGRLLGTPPGQRVPHRVLTPERRTQYQCGGGRP